VASTRRGRKASRIKAFSPLLRLAPAETSRVRA